MQNADGDVSFREPLGQTKVVQISQGETLNHQGVITHEVCCLAAQLPVNSSYFVIMLICREFGIK
jgi:hypothetical protein